MDEFFSGLNCRLRVSGVVADSIMMGIVNSTMEEAYDKVCSKKGDLERLNEKSRFCELAIMQLEWCLRFIQEEVDIYVVESSQEREKLVSELTDTRDRIRKRLEETEFAIKKKDKELKERMENELRLRQALESKVGELASLRVTLELEKTKSDRVREFVHSNQIRGEDSDTGFCELKNSLDQQFWNIKRKLEDGRVHSTDEVQKLNGCSNTLKLEAGALEPEFELVGEGSCNIDDKNFSLKSQEVVQNHGCKQTGFLENDNDSRVEVLNCCVQTEVTDRNLEFEQMGTDIDILKEMLEVGFEMMDNTISLSKVGLLEQQWEWSVEKEMVGLVLRGFLRDVEENFKTKYLEGHKDAIQSSVGDNSPSLIGGIKSLRHELEQLLFIQTEVPSIPPISHESGIPSSSSSHVDFGGMGISQNHTSLKEKSVDTIFSGGDQRKYPTNALRTCGKSDTSLKFQELCHLEDLPEDDLAPHSHHHVAKMIRNHEYIIKKKTEEIEEIDCLKGEFLREKGHCNFRKDKAFNHIKKLIPDIILRLDRIIQECATSGVSLDDYEKGEFSLQKTLSGSILAEEEKVAEAPEKQGNAKVSHSVDAAFIEEIKQLKHAREEFNIQTMIAEELHMILFKGFVEQMYHEVESNEMENLIKEDLYTVSLKEIVREWNNDRESYFTESLIRDEIYQIVFSEVIKDIYSSVTLPNCQESWNQDTTLEDLPLASFLLEISKRNNFMQEQGSVQNTSEAVDDFMILNTELVETDKHFDLGDWKLEELDEESFLQDDAFDSVKSKLENALQQIIMSKVELRELGYSLGIAVGSPEEANHQMALIEGIAQDMPNGEKQWNALESIVTPLKDFSRAITDFEHIINEKQGFHITRYAFFFLFILRGHLVSLFRLCQ